jgi:hypothetical protein
MAFQWQAKHFQIPHAQTCDHPQSSSKKQFHTKNIDNRHERPRCSLLYDSQANNLSPAQYLLPLRSNH